MNANESIRIIETMINNSKQRLGNNGKYFLFWGWSVLICAIINFILIKTNYENPYIIWLSTPFLAILQFFVIKKTDEQKLIKTFADDAIKNIWIALGIAFFITVFLSTYLKENTFTIYILLYAIGTFISGKILQFKPLWIGGLLCFFCCIICTIVPIDIKVLVLAISILISYIIPGHLLVIETKKQNA